MSFKRRIVIEEKLKDAFATGEIEELHEKVNKLIVCVTLILNELEERNFLSESDINRIIT